MVHLVKLPGGGARLVRQNGDVITLSSQEVDLIKSVMNDRGVASHLETHANLSLDALRKAGGI